MHKLYLRKAVFIKVDGPNIKFCSAERASVNIHYRNKRMFSSACSIEHGSERGKILGRHFKLKKVCILFLRSMVLKTVCVLWFFYPVYQTNWLVPIYPDQFWW